MICIKILIFIYILIIHIKFFKLLKHFQYKIYKYKLKFWYNTILTKLIANKFFSQDEYF